MECSVLSDTRFYQCCGAIDEILPVFKGGEDVRAQQNRGDIPPSFNHLHIPSTMDFQSALWKPSSVAFPIILARASKGLRSRFGPLTTVYIYHSWTIHVLHSDLSLYVQFLYHLKETIYFLADAYATLDLITPGVPDHRLTPNITSSA